MHGIFINYRREDVTGFARSVFDRLRSHFGDSQVFMDVSNIEPGLDFIDTIDKGLKSCEALLVLIGPDWESICVERSGEPDDYVRIEIAAALKRKIRVIPVLVQGATMPAEANLPEDIKPLVRRQATALSNDRFDSDIARLIEVLEKTLGGKFKPKPVPDPIKKGWLSGRSGMVVGFVAAFVLLIVIGVWVEDEEFDSGSVNNNEFIHNPDVAGGYNEDFSNESFNERERDTRRNIDSAWSIDQIAQVQLLLQNLGYQPGAVDGVMGENTITAIEQFQRDADQTPSGQINEEFLDALMAAESVQQPAPTMLNLSGTWYDNFGNEVLIQQQGDQVNAVVYDAYSGLQISVSSGTVFGNQLNYRWNANGSSGAGIGIMQQDMRHMDIVVTDDATGMIETVQIHKEHMPGQ